MTVMDEETPMCVGCGERPWGYGYAGEECRECATDADARAAELIRQRGTDDPLTAESYPA